MSNLDVAVATFWQLARHWKNGDKAKLELSCEGESLHLQMSARLGPPDQPHFPPSPLPPPPPPPPPPPSFIPSTKKKSPSQMRRQERRRQHVLLQANLTHAQVSEKDAPENVTVAEEAEAPKATAEKPAGNASSKDIFEKVSIFDDAVKPKGSAEKSKIKPFEKGKETQAVSSCVTFKCDQCSFTSNSDKGLKTHTRMKHRISQLDGHDEDIVSEEKPCPLCPEVTDFCICGTCDECSYIRTEMGFKTHIMNGHEPPDVKKHFGIDWIKAHKHLISRNYADSAQDRYHSKKWDDFMVL